MVSNTSLNTNHKKEAPSAFEVAKEYIKTPTGLQNLVVRPPLYAMRFAELLITSLSEVVKTPKTILGQTNHFLYWIEYPTTLNNLFKSIVKLKDSIMSGSVFRIANKTSKVYVNSTFSIGLIADLIKIPHSQELFCLSSTQIAILEAVGFAGSIGLLFSSIHGIKRQMKVLARVERGSAEYNLALFRLISRVCLAAIAVFSMVAFFEATIITKWAVLSFTTGLLLFNLISNFYDKMHVSKQEKTVAL